MLQDLFFLQLQEVYMTGYVPVLTIQIFHVSLKSNAMCNLGSLLHGGICQYMFPSGESEGYVGRFILPSIAGGV